MTSYSALRAAAAIIRDHTARHTISNIWCRGCEWNASPGSDGHSLHVAELVAAALLPEEPPAEVIEAMAMAMADGAVFEARLAYQALRATLLKGTP